MTWRPTDGSPMLDDDFLLLVNAWWEPIDFTIPAHPPRPDVAPRDRHLDPTGTESSAPAGAADQVAVGPLPWSCFEPRQHPDGAARQLEVRPAPRRRA